MIKHWKKLLGFLVPVAMAGGLFIVENGKPIDPNNTDIAPITFENKQITFTYTDDNTNENLIIKTDKSDYIGWDSDTLYFAVKNISPDDQDTKIQCLFDGGGRCDTIQEFKPHIAYEVDVDDYAKEQTCKKIPNSVIGNCYYEKIGSHKETRYRDEWGTITKQVVEDLQKNAFKKAPDYIKAKDQITYWIPSGQTKYFRALLTFGKDEKGKLKGDARKKFYITAKGHNGGFGSLDPWYGSAGWGYRMAITVDYTKIATTTAITNFPIMISTTTPNLKFTGSGGHVGKNDGTDILVTASDGTTKLNHEIETYNSTTGETILWVSSGATALSTSTNTTYYVYYGNSGASDQQNATAVWDSNYKGVWHLKEDPAGTFPPLKDSTSNAKHLGVQGSGGTQSSVTGQIGNAFYNHKNGQYSTLIASSTSPSGMGNGAQSIEGWVYLNSIFSPTDANKQQIFGRVRDNSYPYSYFLLGMRDDGKLFSLTNQEGVLGNNTPSSLATGQWYHLGLTKSGTTVKIYINGTIELTDTDPYSNLDDAPFVFGTMNNSNIYGADAKYDEVRMSNSARSDSWFKTEYNNQSSPGTFMSWAAEETEPVAGTTIKPPLLNFD